jgi:hypothetical protein
VPRVLTEASAVSCGHGPGQVQTASDAKLSVSGSAVLVQTSVVGKQVALCGTPPATSPTSTPCATVQTATGQASKLTANGAPVLLETLTGTTDGVVSGTTPQALLSATAGQTKLATA